MVDVQPIFSGVGSVVFGIAILCAVRILTPPGESMTGDAVRLALTILGWVLIAVGALGGLLPLSGLLIGPVGLIVVAMMLACYHRAQQRAIVSMLEVAVARLMPLGPIFAAFAAEKHGKVSRQAGRMGELLDAGWPLPAALDRCPGLFTPETAMSVRFGYEAGALAESLCEAEQAQTTRQEFWGQFGGRLIYLFALVLFALPIFVFVMLKIVPSYAKIFEEFGVAMPAITQAMVQGSRLALACWPLLLLVGILAATAGVYGVVRYIGSTNWDPPGARWLALRFHAATLLRTLSVAAERQQPMTEALSLIARWYPAGWVRARVWRALGEVEAGKHWCASLARHRLIAATEQAVLEAAERAGNLPWALRETAKASTRRLAYRLNLLVQLAFPMAILAFGAFEAVFVLGCFMPLVTLIHKCMGA